VRPELNGKLGDHQTSVVKPAPRSPNASTAVGKRIPLATLAIFGFEALLARLLPESGERRWRKHAGENFDVGFFECGDVRGIIGSGIFKAAGIDELETFRLQRRRKAELGVGVGDAFGIAGPERADDFVGGNGTPHGG